MGPEGWACPLLGEQWAGFLLPVEGAAPSPDTLTQALCPFLPGWLPLVVLREHGAEVPVSCLRLQVPI